MKIAVFLMFLLALALSAFVVLTSGRAPQTGMVLESALPATFAEQEAAMFTEGPHWIVRGFLQQGLVRLWPLLSVVVFSCFCTARALVTFSTGRGLAEVHRIAAASVLPLWAGACITFDMLRLLPRYTEQFSYHHDWLGAIRVTLFTSLIASLVPAAVALAAQIRHRAR